MSSRTAKERRRFVKRSKVARILREKFGCGHETSSEADGCRGASEPMESEEVELIGGADQQGAFPLLDSYVAPNCDTDSLGGRLKELRRQGVCLDVALRGHDGAIRAHRIVLVAGSSYFTRVLTGFKHTVELVEYPTVLLNSMVDVLYGEVAVIPREERRRFKRLLKDCEVDFTCLGDEGEKNETFSPPTPPHSSCSETGRPSQEDQQPSTSDGRRSDEPSSDAADSEEECVVVDVKKRARLSSPEGDVICCEDETILIDESEEEGDDDETRKEATGEADEEDEGMELEANYVEECEEVPSTLLETSVEESIACAEEGDSGIVESASETEVGQEVTFRFGVPEEVDRNTIHQHKGCVHVGDVSQEELESRRLLILEVAEENPEWLELKQEGIRKYFCVVCDFVTSEEHRADEHADSHEAQPDFKCYVCGQAFYTKKRMDRHLKEHSLIPCNPPIGKRTKQKKRP